MSAVLERRRWIPRSSPRLRDEPIEHWEPKSRDGEHPALDALLAVWRDYQLGSGSGRLGMKTQGHWAAGNHDFDSMCEEVDHRLAEAMDAVIWDLVEIERAAVLSVHLQCMFRMNREPLDVVYMRARLSMSAGLRKRDVV